MIQLYIIWILFATAAGAMEARVHHWRGSDIGNDKWIHTYYFALRSVVCLGLASLIWSYSIESRLEKSQAIILFISSCLLSFSFFHNGAQYTARRLMDNRLDYHFFSKSKDTNARINLSGWQRLVMFVISSLILLFQ